MRTSFVCEHERVLRKNAIGIFDQKIPTTYLHKKWLQNIFNLKIHLCVSILELFLEGSYIYLLFEDSNVMFLKNLCSRTSNHF